MRATTHVVPLFSDEDADLRDVTWRRGNKGYAKKGRLTEDWAYYAHRVVMRRSAGRPLLTFEYVDHINGQPLDCRRENLRLVTPQANSQHRVKASRSSSGFRGVKKFRDQWMAGIGVAGRTIYLGLYDTPEAAAEAAAAGRRAHGFLGEQQGAPAVAAHAATG